MDIVARSTAGLFLCVALMHVAKVFDNLSWADLSSW